jgi:hypothetical protein
MQPGVLDLISKLSVPIGIVGGVHLGWATSRGGVDVPVVETLSVEGAKRRREQVLASVGGDECDLRDRAARYLLNADELAALSELDELDYLLSE